MPNKLKRKAKKLVSKLKLLPNPIRGEVEITLAHPKFAYRSAVTGRRERVEVEIEYKPGAWLVDPRSLKTFVIQFGKKNILPEQLAVDIGKDFVKFVKPLECEVKVMFHVRGGIAIKAEWEYERL